MQELNRELWLQDALELLRPLYNSIGFDIPCLRVSVGVMRSSNVLGNCYVPDVASDKRSNIFISAEEDDTLTILRVLAHEICHAIRPAAGHGKLFAEIALGIGFLRPMTSTPSGESLIEYFKDIIAEIGEYPHSKLNLIHTKTVNPKTGKTTTRSGGIGSPKRQKSRSLKLECTKCSNILRGSRKVLESGAFRCSCGSIMVALKQAA
jgi:hypothetical protein